MNWKPTAGLLAFAAMVPTASALAAEGAPQLQPADGAPQCRGSAGYSEDFGGRQTFLWRPQWLHTIADRAASDPDIRGDIVADADQAMRRPLYSVTEKTKPVPGAGPNDYASIGPYWWPDPRKSDGLPYTRRDGEVNPERDGPEFDKDRLRSLANDLEALTLAYYVTGEAGYADRSAELLRTWFLTPETRMAPNMNFAQGIPGRVDGRGEGIIEASDLSTAIEAAGLIWSSGALSEEEKAGLRHWYAEFAQWMVTSENGESEMRKRNNHGVFYDFYLAHFALFAGLETVTANVVDNFPAYRLGQQMDRQGRFIEELRRTRSWHYSVFVVQGSARLATIAECVGKDLWRAELSDGRNIGTARNFLTRYAGDPGAWPFPDRDKDAGRLDRMREAYADVELILDRGENIPADITLP